MSQDDYKMLYAEAEDRLEVQNGRTEGTTYTVEMKRPWKVAFVVIAAFLVLTFGLLMGAFAMITDLQSSMAVLKNDTTTAAAKVFNPKTDWYQITSGSKIYSYKLFKEKVNYATAHLKCEKEQASLASVGIRIPAVRDDLIDKLIRQCGSHTWIGLDDLQKQGQYVWADGVISNGTDADWAPGEPNGVNERCAHFSIHADHDYKTNDATCSSLYNYVCEKVSG